MVADSEAFDRGVDDLLGAIDLCFKQRHILPALMLLYSTLDVMAALDRPADTNPVGTKPARTTGIGAQFQLWVEEFMKPRSSVKASPSDIWAWRNGLVHTYSVDSDKTKSGEARRAYYCYGTAQLALLRRTSEVKAHKAVPVKIEHLIAALKTGVERFRRALAKDPSRGERVYSRAKQQFYFLVKQPPRRA